MSRDDRDKAGGHAVRHPRLLDCSCCEAISRHDRGGTRRAQRAAAIDEQLADLDNDDDLNRPHLWRNNPTGAPA